MQALVLSALGVSHGVSQNNHPLVSLYVRLLDKHLLPSPCIDNRQSLLPPSHVHYCYSVKSPKVQVQDKVQGIHIIIFT